FFVNLLLHRSSLSERAKPNPNCFQPVHDLTIQLRACLKTPFSACDTWTALVWCPRFSVFSAGRSLKAGHQTGVFKQALSNDVIFVFIRISVPPWDRPSPPDAPAASKPPARRK